MSLHDFGGILLGIIFRMDFIIDHSRQENYCGYAEVKNVKPAADKGAEGNNADADGGHGGADDAPEKTGDFTFSPHLKNFPIEYGVEKITETDGDFRNI